MIGKRIRYASEVREQQPEPSPGHGVQDKTLKTGLLIWRERSGKWWRKPCDIDRYDALPFSSNRASRKNRHADSESPALSPYHFSLMLPRSLKNGMQLSFTKEAFGCGLDCFQSRLSAEEP